MIVTRPAAQAVEWVDGLRAAGVDAVALPLIGIEPVEPAPLRAAWRDLDRHRLVVFVSPNAVERFFAGRPVDVARAEHGDFGTAPSWPAATLAGSPGPGTSRALRDAGVPAASIVEPPADSPAFDSEALWRVLAGEDWSGRSVLVVRGDGGRESLARTLTAAGARVEHLCAYRRVAPVLDGAATALLRRAIADPAAHVWFFSSSEAIERLRAIAAATPASWSASRAIATHPRIAATARAAGFGRVEGTRPSLPAVVACLQSFAP